MSFKAEINRILTDLDQDGEVGRVVYIKGSLKPREMLRIAFDQINSSAPDNIVITEAMGTAVHPSERIGEIKTLAPKEREERIIDLFDDFYTADVITIEKPTEEVDA